MKLLLLCSVIFAFGFYYVDSISERFFRKQTVEVSKPLKSKSESLARLLRFIASDYFEDCTLNVIYDSTFELSFPIDFQLYFANLPLTLIQETINLSSGGKVNERHLKRCTNYIIFIDNLSSMKHILGQDTKSKIVIVTSEISWGVKDFLKSDLSKSYYNLLIITHTITRRNGYGAYLLYTHKLYADGSGSTMPYLLGSWINNSITVRDLNLFPEKLRNGFMGHRLLVSVQENPPFSVGRALLSSEDSRWDGLDVRLLRLAAWYLNFTVEFTKPRNTDLSPIESVKADVMHGITSAAAGGIYHTPDLTGLFDATSPHFEDCASFISLASTALPKYRAILGPFQPWVWVLLCLAYFILIIPLSFNSNYTMLHLVKHPSALDHMFWFVFSTYTNSFIVKNPLLEYGVAKNAITILLAIYWVFTIIVTACYTGSIVSFITLPAYPEAMETAQELLANRYRIGTLDHNGWEQWFNVNTTDDPFVRKLFRKMEYVPSVMDGVVNASRAYFWPYAFLASRTALDYLIQTDFAPTWTTKRTLMHVGSECFVRFNVIYLFPSKSLYTESVDSFIKRATETGLAHKIIGDVDWEVQRIAMIMHRQITKKISKKIQIEDRVLTVEDTLGMFMLLGIGFGLALLALSCENVANFLRRRKKVHDDDASADDDSYCVDENRFDTWIRTGRRDTLTGIRRRHGKGSESV